MKTESKADELLRTMKSVNGSIFEIVQLELPGLSEKGFYSAFLIPTRDTGVPSPEQLSDDFYESQETMSLKEGRLAVARIASAYIGEAIVRRRNNDRDGAWICVSEANFWLGILLSTYYSKEQPERLHAEVSRRGALARHAMDPRQKEKVFVKECWLAWQANEASYRSKAAFARDMLMKCEHLTSQKKIEDWCRDWEAENEILAGTVSIQREQ